MTTDHGSFDADWLALREPLDAAARSADLVRAFAARLPDQPRLLDLGSGTGSTLRQIARLLGRPAQTWTLLERDPALVARMAPAMAGWAGSDSVAAEGDGLRVSAPGLDLAVTPRQADLRDDTAALGMDAVDGITASALFDLVSRPWAERFAAALAAAGRPPLLFALTVDGREGFDPADPEDGFVLGLFHAHMAGDKGLGPALGPAAPAVLAEVLQGVGYHVAAAPSDWHVGPADLPAHLALLDGYTSAAAELDPDAAPRVAAWAERRRALARDGATLIVGHMDLAAWREG